MSAHASLMPLQDPRRVMDILSKISLLGGLNEAQLGSVLRRLQQMAVRAGERIFEQGDQPSGIYIVQRGQVKIVADIDRTPLELVAFGEGQCFGETSAIGIQPHSATALAVEDTELIVLTGAALNALFKEDPTVFALLVLNIAREACRRLHRTDQLLFHDARRKRVAEASD